MTQDGDDMIPWDEVTPPCGRYHIDPVTGDYSIRATGEYQLTVTSNTMWARIDKDNNLVHLDMDLCAKGPANSYTALAIGVWNAAIEAAAQAAYPDQRDTIRRLKK